MRTKISGKHFKVGALVLVCAILMQLSSGLFVSAQGEAGDSGQNRALNSGGYAGFDLTNATILQAGSGIALGSDVNETNPIQLQYTYNIANVAKGDTYTFNLPKEVLVKDSGKLQQQVFAVLDSGKEIIANGTIATDTNEVKLVFTDKAADVTDAVFSINTDVYFNAPRLMLNGEPNQTIRFEKANGVPLNDVKVNFFIDNAFNFFAETSSGEPFIVLAIDGKDPKKVDIKDVKKDAKIAVKYNFKMPEAAVKTVHPLVPYYFNLPPQTKAQALPLKFDIKNGNTVVAQGVIGGDSNKPNEVTVTFNKNSYGDLDNPNDPNNILYPGTEGEMHFELLFDAGEVGNGGRQDIVFSTPTHGQEVTIPVDFKVDPVTAKLDMAKEATPSFSALNNMSIAWEVKATAKITDPGNPNVMPAVPATVSGVVITDAIESPLVYDDKTGVTVKHYNGAGDKSPITVSGSTVSLDTATTPNYTLKVALPSGSTLKNGEYYTISYNTTFNFDTAYKDAGADKKIRFSNTAAAAFSNTQYIKDTTTGENKGKTVTITEPSKENPKAKKDVELVADFIDKAGALKNGKIDWTVTIKPQSCVFKGGKITDVIPVGLTLENGSVKWNGTAVTEDTTTKPTTTPERYSYVKTAGGTGAFTYVMKNAEVKTDQRLTYTTTVDSGYDKLTNEFINNASFYPTDGPASGFSKVAKVHYGNSVSSKSVGAYVPSVHTLPWTITIGENGGTELVNPVVTDMLPNTLTMLNDTITVNGTKLTLGGGSVALGDNVSVELTQGSTSGSATGYVFTFTGTVKKQYSIKFNTTVNDDKYWAANTSSSAGVNELQNTATLEVAGHANNPVSATPSVPSQILAKSVPKAYDYNTKKAFWQITVNQNKMAMTAPTIVDTLDTAGLTFDEKSIVVKQGNTTIMPQSITLGNDGGTPAKPRITVVLPDMAAGNEPYVISYATNVSDKILMNITDSDRTVKNTAVLSSSTFKTHVSVQAEQKVASPLITKIGENSPSDYSIEWQIMVNQNLAEMQAPLLTDELAEGLTLNPDSIKLEKLTIDHAGKITKAEEVTDTAADYKAVMNGTTQTFTVKFKDKITTAYRLTFKTFCTKDATYGNAVSVTSNGVTLKTDETKTTSTSSSAGGQTRPILGQLKLTKTDMTGNPLAGAEFTLGKVVKTTDEKGEALFDGIRKGIYYVTETKAPKGYVLPAAPDNKTGIEVGETTAGFVHTKEITNVPVKGKLVVTKTDSADLNKKLAGAEFSVTKAGDASFSKTLTTNSVGAAELNDLAIGSYTVTETKAPVGYLLNTTPQSFEVKDTSDNSQVTTPFKLSFSNKMISGKLVVTKTDSADLNKKLAGAKFKVERTASEAAAPPFATLTGATALTTGADGSATLANIPIGSYKVTEEAAPAGYMLDESKLPYTFTVLNNNAQPTADFAYSLSNKKGDGIVEITKTDKNLPTKKLTGAVFTAVEATTKQEYASTEAADGVYVINLPAGTYDITETTAPLGYVKNYTKHLTVASANGGTPVKQSFSATNEGISGTLVVTKTDSADLNKKLAGAEFNVTKAGDTSFSKKITTGADGTARLTGLPVGSYTVTETKAPVGYLLNTTPQSFTVAEGVTEQLNITHSFSNTAISGTLVVTKTDNADLNKKLAGAEFSVTKAGDTSFSKKMTTGADGTARLTGLPVGSYTVTESKAPAGYVLNTVPQEFTIADNGLTTAQPAKALAFSDALAFGTVRLTKTNDDGSIKLAGAEFTAVKTDEPNKGATYIKLTDINGAAEYTLPIGTYTLTETKPPKGYAINTAYMQTVTVTANADPTKQPAPQILADVKNTLILGSLELTKTDTTGKPLKGAKISLYKTDGNLLLGEKESHEDGKLLFDNLPQGEYYYIETVAPSGYVLDESKHAFIIEAHRQMLTQTLKNNPAPHSNDGDGGVDNTPSPPPQIITPPPVEGGTSAPDTVPPNSSGNVPMTPAGKPEVSEEPKNGTVTVDGDGHWEYIPKPGFSGDDEFAVTVRYSDSYSETFVIKMSVLSSVVPFFPETGESSHVPFYVFGALLMAMGLGIRLGLRRRSKK